MLRRAIIKARARLRNPYTGNIVHKSRNLNLMKAILHQIDEEPYDIDHYESVLSVFDLGKHEMQAEVCTKLAPMCEAAAEHYAALEDFEMAERFRRTQYLFLRVDALRSFDHYMLALEFDREPEQRFYAPRRAQLAPVVQALQEMEDGDLDEMFLSMPPRIGKSTLVLFFMTWIIGKHAETSNLYSAFSDTVTKAFYNGVVEILTDTFTYHWSDIFRGHALIEQSAEYETVDIDRKHRYKSLTCRSLYGTLNGACDCSGYLIADDLISGIEEAMNPDRLQNAWAKVVNDLLSRTKKRTKIIWIGTRWSLLDPIGRRRELVTTDYSFRNRRTRVLDMPALDENDESNFDYDYDVGYSTENFHRIRATFERDGDMPSWFAMYMQEPIERAATVFDPTDFRYYNGTLPDGPPDRVFMAVDPAYGGGDFVAAPVCVQYDSDVYVSDVVYNKSDKLITQPLVATTAMKNGVTLIQVEASRATASYAEGIQDCLAAKGWKATVTIKPSNHEKQKEYRIFEAAPDIRTHFIFLAEGKRSKEYAQFMTNVFSFKMEGDNKHDDAPDALAQAAMMFTAGFHQSIRAIRRPF